LYLLSFFFLIFKQQFCPPPIGSQQLHGRLLLLVLLDIIACTRLVVPLIFVNVNTLSEHNLSVEIVDQVRLALGVLAHQSTLVILLCLVFVIVVYPHSRVLVVV